MHYLHTGQMCLQGLTVTLGQGHRSIFITLAITHRKLAVMEIDIFNPQANTPHQAYTTTLHQARICECFHTQGALFLSLKKCHRVLNTTLSHSPRFEPAIEFFAGEGYNKGVGPLIMGRELLGPAKMLRWELGANFAINNNIPDLTIKTSLEYEF